MGKGYKRSITSYKFFIKTKKGMIKTLLFTLLATLFMLLQCLAQNEPFTAKFVLNQAPANVAERYYLQHPFEILVGPDDSLWISERRGRVMKVNATDGRRRIILDIQSSVRFTTSGSPVTSISQDGMMGLALHPDYPAVDSFYIAYVYNAAGNVRKVRIARYPVKNLLVNTRAGNETVIIENIPASSDHSSGRLLVGPDRMLYYSVGDQGANQFSLRCNPIRAQDVPTAVELAANNFIAYQGKTLRINPDGTVPADNPIIKGIRSHIYTFGHRNPNSLVFAKNTLQQDYVGAKLYSAENGPAEDDEINELIAGKNYGWPYYSGYADDNRYQYKNWSSATNCAGAPSPSLEPECSTPPAGTVLMNETDTVLPNFKAPIRTFFTPSGPLACSWLSNPTVAPASMDYYGYDTKIPGWQNSILMSTLKEGTVFRLKLNATGTGFVNMSNGSDTARYFRQENRLRDIAIGSDGITFFLVTDSVGQTSGPTTGQQNILNDHGSILMYRYLGSTLNIGHPLATPVKPAYSLRIYPNPATKILFIESIGNTIKPLSFIVFDVMGRREFSGRTAKDKFEINVSSLAVGTYFIKLFNAVGIEVLTDRFVVQ
jgi:PQQ-dependent dehydrogenase (s-GDH family)